MGTVVMTCGAVLCFRGVIEAYRVKPLMGIKPSMGVDCLRFNQILFFPYRDYYFHDNIISILFPSNSFII